MDHAARMVTGVTYSTTAGSRGNSNPGPGRIGESVHPDKTQPTGTHRKARPRRREPRGDEARLGLVARDR